MVASILDSRHSITSLPISNMSDAGGVIASSQRPRRSRPKARKTKWGTKYLSRVKHWLGRISEGRLRSEEDSDASSSSKSAASSSVLRLLAQCAQPTRVLDDVPCKDGYIVAYISQDQLRASDSESARSLVSSQQQPPWNLPSRMEESLDKSARKAAGKPESALAGFSDCKKAPTTNSDDQGIKAHGQNASVSGAPTKGPTSRSITVVQVTGSSSWDDTPIKASCDQESRDGLSTRRPGVRRKSVFVSSENVLDCSGTAVANCQQPLESSKSLSLQGSCSLSTDALCFRDSMSTICSQFSDSSPGHMTDFTECDHVLYASPNLPQHLQRDRWTLDDFKEAVLLHEGYAANVYLAQCKVSNEPVAVKVYPLASLSARAVRVALREAELHARLRHPNIVQLFATFQEDGHLLLLQEYAGNITLQTGHPWDERAAVKKVVRPLVEALAYLHSDNIAHRDVKPANIVFDEKGVLRLVDMGLAVDVSDKRPTRRAGTLSYMAPEVVRCGGRRADLKSEAQSGYGTPVDVWSLGVLTHELLLGRRPFDGPEASKIVHSILHKRLELPSSLTIEAKDFICRTLCKDANERPTVQELMGHPWLNDIEMQAANSPQRKRRKSTT